MTRPDLRSINWWRIGVEGVAIVVSILLAFAIDAWWTDVQENRLEKGYFELLRREFMEAQREMTRDLADRGSIVDATILLLEQSYGDTLAPPDTIDAWMLGLTNRKRFQPPHAVFDNLAASGSMIAVESDSLREALFEYNRMRDRYALIEQWEETYYYDTLEPYLRQNTETPYRAKQTEISQAWVGTAAYGSVFQEQSFRNIMVERLSNARLALNQAQAISQVIDNVVALLEEAT